MSSAWPPLILRLSISNSKLFTSTTLPPTDPSKWSKVWWTMSSCSLPIHTRSSANLEVTFCWFRVFDWVGQLFPLESLEEFQCQSWGLHCDTSWKWLDWRHQSCDTSINKQKLLSKTQRYYCVYFPIRTSFQHPALGGDIWQSRASPSWLWIFPQVLINKVTAQQTSFEQSDCLSFGDVKRNIETDRLASLECDHQYILFYSQNNCVKAQQRI